MNLVRSIFGTISTFVFALNRSANVFAVADRISIIFMSNCRPWI